MPIRFPAEPTDRVFAMHGMRHMSVLLRLDAKLDVDRIRQALQQILDAVPLLKCRFVERGWVPHWEADDDVSANAMIVVQAAGSAHDNGALPAHAIQLVLHPGTSDGIEIFFDHAIGDFRAMLKFVQLLGETYSELEQHAGYVLPPLPVTERGFKKIARALPFAERRRVLRTGFQAIRAARRVGKWRVPPFDPSTYVERREVVAHRFDLAEAEQLESYALRRRATTFQMLLAAYFLALTKLMPDSDEVLTVNILVDLRRRLGSQAPFVFGNLVGIERIHLRRQPDASLEGVTDAVRDHMYGVRKSSLGESFSPLFWECLPFPLRWLGVLRSYHSLQRMHRRRRQERRAARELVSVGATFGGSISSERLRFGSARVCAAAPEFRPLETQGFRTLQVFSFDGDLSLTFGWGAPEEMAAIRDAVLCELRPVFATAPLNEESSQPTTTGPARSRS